MPDFFQHKNILKVSELTCKIKNSLEAEFNDLWVEGEISNFRIPSSGHFYFTLKDSNSQIRGVIFRYQNRALRFTPKDGMQIICHGRITLYEPKGEYQIIVDFMEPVGYGALQKAFEDLKRRLKDEGLFDEGHKVPIPFLPKRIGVITSPTGAAIRDILNILFRRYPNIGVLIFPVKVQGEEAPSEIAQAIYESQNFLDIDLLIVGRGGGSIEDLWAFNEEIVARAIYDSKIPIISAVGHEIDFTIADFVADKRAPTPSAAAELAVPVKSELLILIKSLKERLEGSIKKRIDIFKREVHSLEKRIIDPRKRLADIHIRLDDLSSRLINLMLSNLLRRKEKLKYLSLNLYMQSPSLKTRKLRTDILHIKKNLIDSMKYVIEERSYLVKILEEKLNSLGPLLVLNRGYSIVRLLPDKKIVTNILDVKCGDNLEIILQKGKIIAQVVMLNDKSFSEVD